LGRDVLVVGVERANRDRDSDRDDQHRGERDQHRSTRRRSA
jgi:hypothetical protein